MSRPGIFVNVLRILLIALMLIPLSVSAEVPGQPSLPQPGTQPGLPGQPAPAAPAPTAPSPSQPSAPATARPAPPAPAQPLLPAPGQTVPPSSVQPAPPQGQTGVQPGPLPGPQEGAAELKGPVLSLDRAIQLALTGHPSILAARGTVDVNQSRIGQAQANYYPQVNAAAGYTRGYAVRSAGSTTLVSGGYDQYTSAFTASQNIYDFGRTSSRVGVQRFTTESSKSDLANVVEQVVLGLKQAYFALLQAQRNLTVAQETVQQFQQHLEQAQGFFEVGTKSKFDVTKAEVDLSNAKLNLIRANNAVRLAKVTLDNAVGLTGSPEYTVEDVLSYQPFEIPLEEALKKAFDNRPDLKSILARQKAAEESIRAAKSDYYPFLNGQANYGYTGNDFPLSEGWAVGATLNFPIFSGLLTKYQVTEAKSNLKILNANEQTIRQTVTLDVQQAFLNISEASQRISTAELTVRQAAENLDLANGRYAAGVGSPIEVTDALVNYSNAKTTYNQALYDYKVAQASMDKAIGVRY